MKCPHCHAELAEASNFCPKCGGALTEKPAAKSAEEPVTKPAETPTGERPKTPSGVEKGSGKKKLLAGDLALGERRQVYDVEVTGEP